MHGVKGFRKKTIPSATARHAHIFCHRKKERHAMPGNIWATLFLAIVVVIAVCALFAGIASWRRPPPSMLPPISSSPSALSPSIMIPRGKVEEGILRQELKVQGDELWSQMGAAEDINTDPTFDEFIRLKRAVSAVEKASSRKT